MLICWTIAVILITILYVLYVQSTILLELKQTKCMLKVLPVSFARKSERMGHFIATIINEVGM